jgi:hypothetical protein
MSQEPLPPLIRLEGPEGQVLFPRLEKGPDGNWQVSEPEKIRSMIGLDETGPGKK